MKKKFKSLYKEQKGPLNRLLDYFLRRDHHKSRLLNVSNSNC